VADASQTTDDDPLARLAELEGVASGFAATRDGIDAMLRDRGLRRTAPDLTGESLLRGAHASAVLEGSESTLEDIREGAAGLMAVAAVRVTTELLGLAPTLEQAPSQVFARLHALAGKGIAADEDLGRPRTAEAADRLSGLAGAPGRRRGARRARDGGALRLPQRAGCPGG
jgi:hypothetical protein